MTAQSTTPAPVEAVAGQDEQIVNHLASLLDEASGLEATALALTPEFDACWKDGAGKGELINPARALQLRPFVLDGASNAKHYRDLHAKLVAALAASPPPPAEVDREAVAWQIGLASSKTGQRFVVFTEREMRTWRDHDAGHTVTPLYTAPLASEWDAAIEAAAIEAGGAGLSDNPHRMMERIVSAIRALKRAGRAG